jgi:hypothetical protein
VIEVLFAALHGHHSTRVFLVFIAQKYLTKLKFKTADELGTHSTAIHFPTMFGKFSGS